MGVAEGGEIVHRAREIERTGRLQCRHQDRFVRAENAGCLTHETHARHHQGGSGRVAAETRHFQRIGDKSPALFRQLLDQRIRVVMRHQHGILLLQQRLDARLVVGHTGGIQSTGKGNCGEVFPYKAGIRCQ